MKEKSLGKCTVPFLEDTFNLNQIQHSDTLNHWLTIDYNVSGFEKRGTNGKTDSSLFSQRGNDYWELRISFFA